MPVVGVAQTGKVERAVVAQLRQFQSAVVQFTRKTLNMGGRAIRLRLTRERLSGIRYARNKAPKGAPLSRRTGKLIRSIYAKPADQGDQIVLFVSIGGGAAYYAEIYEDNGRLQFRRIVGEEMKQIQENLAIGFQFLAKNPGAQYGALSPGVEPGIEDFFAARDKEIFFSSKRLRDRGGRPKKGAAKRNSFLPNFKEGFWDKDGLMPKIGALNPSSERARWRSRGFGGSL